MGPTRRYEVTLGFGSWVYLAGLLGLCGGFVAGVLSAVIALTQARWLESLGALVLTGPALCLTLALYGVVSFPVYKWLSTKTPAARTLSANIKEAEELKDGDAP